ncbi:MAG TPA: NUDIX domain-containing protein [Gemmatimonadales bacterium]|nr:NUDIX domain-containing protein [Gemmatimonadales bacterium]
MPTNEATVCYLCAGGKVLLQRRAAGRLWAGRLNGPGGKIDAGETATTAIVREVQEETGVRLDAQRPAGSLDLRFGDPPSQSLLVHVFTSDRFIGRPRGGREGGLRWYGIHRLPFDDLWPDMRYWLPLVLAGGKVSGTCEYDSVGAALRACRLTLEWPQR